MAVAGGGSGGGRCWAHGAWRRSLLPALPISRRAPHRLRSQTAGRLVLWWSPKRGTGRTLTGYCSTLGAQQGRRGERMVDRAASWQSWQRTWRASWQSYLRTWRASWPQPWPV